MKAIAILALIGAIGYLDRGFVDWLGLGAIAVLLIPILIALKES